MGRFLNPDDLSEYSEAISEHVEDPNIFSTFIETGTAYGQSIDAIRQYFEKVFTVEISEKLYEWLTPQIGHWSNVERVLGDSLIEIPKYLNSLAKEDHVFFWLDAHWSQGLSSKNHLDVPLLEECSIIDKEYQADLGLVVIDDVRLFETELDEDWSGVSKEKILKSFENFDILVTKEIDDRLLLLIKRK